MRAKDFRKQAWQNLSGKWGTMIAIYLLYVVIISASCIVAVGPLLLAGSLTLGVFNSIAQRRTQTKCRSF